MGQQIVGTHGAQRSPIFANRGADCVNYVHVVHGAKIRREKGTKETGQGTGDKGDKGDKEGHIQLPGEVSLSGCRIVHWRFNDDSTIVKQ
jgi:hypothetical protein